ncbi:MAG: GntR family transcriptional regulator [Treponema sp.]|jgi:K+/H+ antiporter YhaU regulatory subunit KhtT|nr:GntR family transcriptional regulator [Treponema sp.]
MSEGQKITTSVYRQIAIDIAQDIAQGKYTTGQKLFGRSVLASYYQVSSETIRKAVFILKDVGIVDTEKGSGIEVKSVEKAREFIDRHNEVENVITVRNEIMHWAERQAQETDYIIEKIQFVIHTTERFKNSNPFTPYEIKITEDSPAIGKTANELHFWQNTGATIIAIRRGEALIISPGPYATFNKDDIFYLIGNDQAYAASIQLLGRFQNPGNSRKVP